MTVEQCGDQRTWLGFSAERLSDPVPRELELADFKPRLGWACPSRLHRLRRGWGCHWTSRRGGAGIVLKLYGGTDRGRGGNGIGP